MGVTREGFPGEFRSWEMRRRCLLNGHWHIPRFPLFGSPACHPMVFLMPRAGGAPQENQWISSTKILQEMEKIRAASAQREDLGCDQWRTKGLGLFLPTSAIPVLLRMLQMQLLTPSSGQATAPRIIPEAGISILMGGTFDPAPHLSVLPQKGKICIS